MLEKRLEYEKNRYNSFKPKCIIWGLIFLTLIIASIVCMILILRSNSYASMRNLLILSLLIFLFSFPSGLSFLNVLHNMCTIRQNIDDILLRQSLPTEYYRKITIDGKETWARYVESTDSVEYL